MRYVRVWNRRRGSAAFPFSMPVMDRTKASVTGSPGRRWVRVSKIGARHNSYRAVTQSVRATQRLQPRATTRRVEEE
jgi:hypothetical protein